MLTLVTRVPCGLCERAEEALREAGVPYRTVDVDQDEGLFCLYNEAVPVLLLDGRELLRAPITRQALRDALRGAGLAPIP